MEYERLYRLLVVFGVISAAASSSDVTVEESKKSEGVLEGLDPSFGPRAGGTLLTLTGRHLQDPYHGDIVTVSLREAGVGVIYSCSVVESSLPDRIVARTPVYKGADDQVKLLLEVRYSNGTQKQSYSSTFNYRPDPDARTLQPGSTIAAGGTTLTVFGSFLDSVAKPQVSSSIFRRGRFERNLNNQQAYFVNATCAKFRLPAVDIPGYGSVNATHDVTLLVGLIFDAIRYENKSHLVVIANPIVQPWSPKELPYSQESDEIIRVNVTWPSGDEISMDDITIMVGTRNCLNIVRKDGQLSCEPPHVPEPTIRNGPESISKPTVLVRIGYQETAVGIILFAAPEGIHILIFIMSGILAVMFIIAFLFGCIALCSSRRGHHKKKPGRAQERPSISYAPVDDQDEMARRRSRVRLSKDSIVEIPQQYQRNRSNSNTSSTAAAGEKSEQQLEKIQEHKEPAGGQSKVVFTDMSK